MSGYNWWARRAEGLDPIIALVNLGNKLGCGFDVSFDAGPFEQAWAVREGLAASPRRRRSPAAGRKSAV